MGSAKSNAVLFFEVKKGVTYGCNTDVGHNSSWVKVSQVEANKCAAAIELPFPDSAPSENMTISPPLVPASTPMPEEW